MNLSFYIAKRYAISFSKNKAINIITGIASVGIIASTMALFIFLSVFSGLKEFTLNLSEEEQNWILGRFDKFLKKEITV